MHEVFLNVLSKKRKTLANRYGRSVTVHHRLYPVRFEKLNLEAMTKLEKSTEQLLTSN